LSFGHGVSAHATLALWLRPVPDRFEPLIAEFGFSTRVTDSDKDELGQHAADDFFKSLQGPLKDYLSDGTTKTALIYGDNAS
jgi:hypothetical protein